MRLDSYDVKILQILSKDGRITKSALAEAINLSVSPCWHRLKRLESAGIITGYSARINPGVLSKRSDVLVEITLKRHDAQSFAKFEAVMNECPKVTECYATGGGVDYLVKVNIEDIDQYQRLIDSWLDKEIGIDVYYTYIVTKTVKQIDPLVDILEEML